MLHDVELEVKTGQLVMVVGEVGCGKSSLLCALLGEMYSTTADVHVAGDVACCSFPLSLQLDLCPCDQAAVAEADLYQWISCASLMVWARDQVRLLYVMTNVSIFLVIFDPLLC
jgi:ABC-type cobalamin/Fe3+-siderophores transport system ATPase subunit